MIFQLIMNTNKETNSSSITRQQFLSLADKFSKIEAKKQSEYLLEIANNDKKEMSPYVLEAFQSLYNYMSKSK